MFQVMVSATIVSLLVTPYLVAAGPRVGGWLGRWWDPRRGPTRRDPTIDDEDRSDADGTATIIDDSIMIIGYGPAGQRVAEELMGEFRERIAVLDMNIDNVKFAWRYGLAAVVGDATQIDVLEHAGVGRARVVVITVPSVAAARQLIHHVRHISPSALVICRSRYHIHRWELLRAGADAVIDEEDQVGHRMALEVQAILKPEEEREG
jgi:CPA2 family monovalent cation:H+ antiporter-2